MLPMFLTERVLELYMGLDIICIREVGLGKRAAAVIFRRL